MKKSLPSISPTAWSLSEFSGNKEGLKLPKKPQQNSVRGKKLLLMGSGNGSNFEAIVHFVRSHGVEVCGLFCNRQKATILQRAKRLQVTSNTVSRSISKTPKLLEEAVIKFLQQDFDCLALAGYMKILPASIVKAYSPKIINIHPSLLPMYPGLHAIERAFQDKQTAFGVSIHIVNEQVDQGALLAQASLQHAPNESLEQLLQRIHLLEHWLYPRTILSYLSK